jgi:hypothetical protein
LLHDDELRAELEGLRQELEALRRRLDRVPPP